jgi:hypothetical protein
VRAAEVAYGNFEGAYTGSQQERCNLRIKPEPGFGQAEVPEKRKWHQLKARVKVIEVRVVEDIRKMR